MKIVMIAPRSTDHSPEDFLPHLETEATRAFEYVEEDCYREIDGLRDGRSAIIAAKAKSEEDARSKMAEMSLSKVRMLN